MVKMAMTTAPSEGSQGQMAGTSAAPVTSLPNSQVNVPQIGSLADLRQEIDDAYEEMKEFISMEPDQIMTLCAGHSARLNEIRTRIQRVEDMPQFRILKGVRQNELEPTIKELQFQFQVASRLFAVRQLDYELSRGQPT